MIAVFQHINCLALFCPSTPSLCSVTAKIPNNCSLKSSKLRLSTPALHTVNTLYIYIYISYIYMYIIRLGCCTQIGADLRALSTSKANRSLILGLDSSTSVHNVLDVCIAAYGWMNISRKRCFPYLLQPTIINAKESDGVSGTGDHWGPLRSQITTT